LSNLALTVLILPSLTAGASGPNLLGLALSGAGLGPLVVDFLVLTVVPCNLPLRAAGFSTREFGDVFLVGGLTRMPKVVDVVISFFGVVPRKKVIRMKRSQSVP
jgi:Molecular chaperone